MTKLDYSIQDPEKRKQIVEQILSENPNPSEKYLEILADYLVLCMDKLERKNKKLLTDNRMLTLNKRETSFEGIVSQLENGEDGIYNLINTNKYSLLEPKKSITTEDYAEIPALQQIKTAIDSLQAALPKASGKNAYIIKHTIIDLRKDQYIIKEAYRKPIHLTKLTKSSYSTSLLEDYDFDEEDRVIPSGVNLCNYKVCAAILSNYSKLKEDSYDNFEGDMWYLIYDFEKACDAALRDYPLYMRLVELKIDGASNHDIQNTLDKEFGVRHTPEYLSALFRKKIPKLIAQQAEQQFLDYYFRECARGKFKKCTKCGQIKLAHPMYFSRNMSSKFGFYSICKECRNKRSEEK